MSCCLLSWRFWAYVTARSSVTSETVPTVCHVLMNSLNSVFICDNMFKISNQVMVEVVLDLDIVQVCMVFICIEFWCYS